MFPSPLERRLSVWPNNRYLLLVPEGYDPAKRYPLWVALHGNQGSAEDSMAPWYHEARRRGVFVLAAQGSLPLGRSRTRATWDDEQDPEAIAAMTREVQKAYSIDPARTALFGFSRGGFIALVVVAREPGLFPVLGLIATGLPQRYLQEALWDEAQFAASAKKTAVCYCCGTKDTTFPPDVFRSTSEYFARLGCDFETHLVEDARHDERPHRPYLYEFFERRTRQGPPPAPASWSVELSGKWRARLVTILPETEPLLPHRDGGISPAALDQCMPTCDDRTWQEVPVPCPWEAYGEPWASADGEALFRKTVDIPEAVAGKDLWLHLGVVDDFDDTFFNGERIGHTDIQTPYYLAFSRVYRVPGHLVKPGKNLIAVRVFDQFGEGGITGGLPGEMKLETAES